MKKLFALLPVVLFSVSCNPPSDDDPFRRLDLLTWGERTDYYSIVGPDCGTAYCRKRLKELQIILVERIATEG